MGTKSVPEIVESAIAAFLTAQTGLSGVNVYKGIANANTTLPLIVVSCGSVAPAPDIPGDFGNYECSVSIQLFTSADASNALTNHRDRSAVIQGAMQQELGVLKTAFTTQGDATCYDADYQSQDSGQGDRALETTINYKVTIVLPA
jgi:hypothetical protein